MESTPVYTPSRLFVFANFICNKQGVLKIYVTSDDWQFITENGSSRGYDGKLTLLEALTKFCFYSPENVKVSDISLVGTEEILTAETLLSFTAEMVTALPRQFLCNCTITIS